jgi:hypothetical protein
MMTRSALLRFNVHLLSRFMLALAHPIVHAWPETDAAAAREGIYDPFISDPADGKRAVERAPEPVVVITGGLFGEGDGNISCRSPTVGGAEMEYLVWGVLVSIVC